MKAANASRTWSSFLALGNAIRAHSPQRSASFVNGWESQLSGWFSKAYNLYQARPRFHKHAFHQGGLLSAVSFSSTSLSVRNGFATIHTDIAIANDAGTLDAAEEWLRKHLQAIAFLGSSATHPRELHAVCALLRDCSMCQNRRCRSIMPVANAPGFSTAPPHCSR